MVKRTTAMVLGVLLISNPFTGTAEISKNPPKGKTRLERATVLKAVEVILKARESEPTLESSNEQTTEGIYTGPIQTWITHTDIDESEVHVFDISGGTVTLEFEEQVWNGWGAVDPNGQTAGPGGSISNTREVDSDFYDGDHRLKVTCGADVKYHLKFVSKDR